MKLSQEIINFINPLKLAPGISSFQELGAALKNEPEYSLLPIDFFENVISGFPHYDILAQGVWVEIGVWKGGGALFFKAIMKELHIDKHLYLFDTYGNIPVTILKHTKDLHFAQHFSLTEEEFQTEYNYKQKVIDLFDRFGLNENVTFSACDINQLAKKNIPEKIAFLHIDVDFFETTLNTLQLFYDNVLPGGIIIIDDYYMEMLNCKDAVDYFFANRNINLTDCGSQFSSYALIITKPR